MVKWALPGAHRVVASQCYWTQNDGDARRIEMQPSGRAADPSGPATRKRPPLCAARDVPFESGASSGGNRLRLRGSERHRNLLPLAHPEEDLERKGAEDR